MIQCIVVAGGKATRMGPWAPVKKPFLSVGKGMVGLSVTTRALLNMCRMAAVVDIAATFGISIGADKDYSLALSQVPKEMTVAIKTDVTPSPLLGPLTAFATCEPVTDRKQAWKWSKKVTDSLTGFVLHNGDDLIHPDSVLLFLQRVKDHPHRMILLATERVQRGQFGMITAANTIDEKPILAMGWIGAGLIYVPIEYAMWATQQCIENASVLINRLYNEKQTITEIVRSPYPWATIGNPEEYLKACEDPIWA